MKILVFGSLNLDYVYLESASLAASLRVSKKGAVSSIPTVAEVGRAKKNLQMVMAESFFS